MSYHHHPSGYLRKRGHRWQACVDDPDPDRPGKRKTQNKSAGTKKEAQALLDAVLAEHRDSRSGESRPNCSSQTF